MASALEPRTPSDDGSSTCSDQSEYSADGDFVCREATGGYTNVVRRTCCERLRYFTWVFLTCERTGPWILQRAAVVYQICMAVIVVVLFLVDSITDLTVTTRYYYVLELAATLVWCLEYIFRVWSCVEADAAAMLNFRHECRFRIRFMFSAMMILDSISIVSLIIDLNIESNQLRGVSALRMLRLFTLYRIERDWKLFSPLLVVIAAESHMLGAAVGLALMVLLTTSVIMFYIEGPFNDKFSSVTASMWWGTTALTTVGYGDMYPETPMGRFVGSIAAFIGVGLFALPAGILTSGFTDATRRRRKGKAGARAVEPASLAGGNQEIQASLAVVLDRLGSRIDGRLDEMNLRLGRMQSDIDFIKKRLDI